MGIYNQRIGFFAEIRSNPHFSNSNPIRSKFSASIRSDPIRSENSKLMVIMRRLLYYILLHAIVTSLNKLVTIDWPINDNKANYQQ